MEAKGTWNCVQKLFQVTVTEDSAPNDNSWIGFGFIFSSPLPLAMLRPKKDSIPPFLLKIQLCLRVRGGVASFTNITGKVPTLVTFIGSLNFSVYRQILALTI